MSAVFDLDLDGQDALAERARKSQPAAPGDPGFFSGVPTSIGMGVMRGGARLAQAAGMAGGGLLSFLERQPDESTGGFKSGSLTDPYFKSLDEYTNDAVHFWTPGANEVGTAGRILGGFSEMALPLMVAAGNPSALIGTSAMSTGHDLTEQGVDAKTATQAAVVQSAATAAGFRIPFLGSNLITKMLTGAAGNVTVNAGSAAATREILKQAGYTDAAASFKPGDLESRIVDVLSGVAFGGLAHLATRDAVATAANAKHFQEDSAPGMPADVASSIAHQNALEAAINDVLEGKPVDISQTGVTEANFHPFEKRPALTEIPEELQGVDEALKAEPTHADQIASAEIPDETRAQLLQHYDTAAQVKPAFDAGVRNIAEQIDTPHEPMLPGLKGVPRAVEKTMVDYGGDATRLKDLVRGTVVVDNLDQAQKALEGIRGHFGEPVDLRDALAPGSPPISKEGYRDIKANVKIGDHTTEIQVNVPEMIAAKKQAHKFYDEHRAIEAKATSENRDYTPEEVSRLDALTAKQQKIYAAAWDSFLTRSRNTSSDTKVPLWEKDEEGNLRPSGTSQARQTQSLVSEQGTPSTSANSVPAANEAGSDISNTSSRSIPESGGRSADPIVVAANQALATRDFTVPTGEFDLDGRPITRSAREVMTEAAANVAQAHNDAKAFDALANCILMRGEG